MQKDLGLFAEAFVACFDFVDKIRRSYSKALAMLKTCLANLALLAKLKTCKRKCLQSKYK